MAAGSADHGGGAAAQSETGMGFITPLAEPAPLLPYHALPREIAFLEGRHLDRSTLARADRLARQWHVSPEQALIKAGLMTTESYYRALAAHLGLGFTPLNDNSVDWQALDHPKGAAMAKVNIVPLARQQDGLRVAVAPSGRGLRSLLAVVERSDAARQLAGHIHLSTPEAIASALRGALRPQLSAHALYDLRQRKPSLSAASGASSAQTYVMLTSCLAAMAGIAVSSTAAAGSLLLICSLLFMGQAALRSAAILQLSRTSPGKQVPASVPDDELPVYTVLVPLVREAQVLPRLIDAMIRLDYPRTKLDIKLILEENDPETIAAAQAASLPSHFDIVIVPYSQPQTKPKALNYALQFARGDLVTIYDAEDRPEPDQLRRAAAAFKAAPDHLVCLQARLNFYNADENWLTRQFATEYAALFDGLLPALARLHLPMPLGGTSNHFRRHALELVGGWDPYNVTEDADLGMRFVRHGYRCATLASVTYEEAVGRFWPWMKQRTRWLKGWIQTFIVHSRHPAQAIRQFGPTGMLVFIVLTAGTIISAATYPVFLACLLYALFSGQFPMPPQTIAGAFTGTAGMVNLVLGYGAALGLAMVGLTRRNLVRLLPQLIWMPFYWLLVSLAAYRAIIQYLTAPFAWEKTEHRAAHFRLINRRR